VARKITGKGEDSEEKASCGSSKNKYAAQAEPLPEKSYPPPPSYTEATADANSSQVQLKKSSSG